MSDLDQRRAHYRLRYPEAERPVICVGGRDFDVLELSESGGRVLVAGEPVVAGYRFHATVRFRDGGPAWVQGDWLRTEGDEGVMRFAVGVSLRRMLDEQRRLLRLYPDLFAGPGPNDDPTAG